jgi:hypothetical protein
VQQPASPGVSFSLSGIRLVREYTQDEAAPDDSTALVFQSRSRDE